MRRLLLLTTSLSFLGGSGCAGGGRSTDVPPAAFERISPERPGSSNRCQADSNRSVHTFPKPLRLERWLRKKAWKNKRIRTELLGLSIQDALMSVAEQTGTRINVSPDLVGIVSSPVKGANLVDALNGIIRPNGADWRYDLRRRVLYVAGIQEGSVGRHQILSTYVTKSRFIEAGAIVKMIPSTYRHHLSIDKESGLIKVVAPGGLMARIYDEIEKTDRQPAQVLLDLSIYEVDHSESYLLGRASESSNLRSALIDPIDELSGISGQVVLGAAASNLFLSRMQALSRDGRARIVSAPKAIVVDGSYAEFMTTETLIENLRHDGPTASSSGNGFSALKEVSLRTGMKVRPVVVPRRRLMLHIKNAESSSLAGGERFGVKNHRLSTNVVIRSGRTLLLGGAIYEKDSLEVTGVPFLKDLWLVGALFSQKVTQKKRVKVIFSIRPRILSCKKEKRKAAGCKKEKKGAAGCKKRG